MQFWNRLQPDLDLISKINDMLTEQDMLSVRDLYQKIKSILSQENAERMFGITDSELLDLHDLIDRRFQQMVTDTHETDEILMKQSKQNCVG